MAATMTELARRIERLEAKHARVTSAARATTWVSMDELPELTKEQLVELLNDLAACAVLNRQLPWALKPAMKALFDVAWWEAHEPALRAHEGPIWDMEAWIAEQRAKDAAKVVPLAPLREVAPVRRAVPA